MSNLFRAFVIFQLIGLLLCVDYDCHSVTSPSGYGQCSAISNMCCFIKFDITSPAPMNYTLCQDKVSEYVTASTIMEVAKNMATQQKIAYKEITTQCGEKDIAHYDNPDVVNDTCSVISNPTAYDSCKEGSDMCCFIEVKLKTQLSINTNMCFYKGVKDATAELLVDQGKIYVDEYTKTKGVDYTEFMIQCSETDKAYYKKNVSSYLRVSFIAIILLLAILF